MREFDIFTAGWVVGMIMAGGIAIFTFSGDTQEIRSNVIITPEKLLTTDGKTIDTIYIYKIK